MIKLFDILLEGGTGMGSIGGSPDFISAGKRKDSHTDPNGLNIMQDDELEENTDTVDMPTNKVLAKYTDNDGYTVIIRGGIEPQHDFGGLRKGTMFIATPQGQAVFSGYWVGRPEKHWNISDEKWDKMPWSQKATLEAKEQATKYEPLKIQFKRNVDLGRIIHNIKR